MFQDGTLSNKIDFHNYRYFAFPNIVLFNFFLKVDATLKNYYLWLRKIYVKQKFNAMKKIITFFLFLFVGVLVFGQGSPRMVLWEQFTNTSCGPCAGFNPQAEAYWEDHQDEVVGISYHVWWPGANDPFYQANTAEQQWRTNYYGCNSVPWTTIDGNKYNANPSMGAIQTAINNQLAIPAPFSIDLNHSLSGNNETVSVTMDITCTDDISGNMAAFIVVIETVVDFANPPGSNGETHFVNVFKKFLPNNSGTALPGSMNVGDSQLVEEEWDLQNFYDFTNLAVVAFIQNTSTKEIYQAAYSAPSGPDYVEPEIKEVTRPVSEICGDNFVPKVVVRNLGGVNLTTLDFEYNVDDADTYLYSWEGDLEYTDEVEVELPPISFTPSTTNTFNVTILNPNGEPDPNPDNNSESVDFGPAPETSTNIEMQLFVGAGGSDISWEFYSYDGEVLASGSDYGNNEIINMELPLDGGGCYGFTLLDSQGDGFAGGGYLKLYDDGLVFAYITDELEDIVDIPFHAMNPLAGPTEFQASVEDYDVTFEWTAPAKAVLEGYNIYEASDMENPINDALITETSYNYTVTENGDYEFYLAAVYDEGMSDFVGPVFIDINVGIEELQNGDFNIYPNPISQNAQIALTLKKNAQVEWSIISLTGSIVMESALQTLSAGQQMINLNTGNLEDGIYFINLKVNDESITKKITVIK